MEQELVRLKAILEEVKQPPKQYILGAQREASRPKKIVRYGQGGLVRLVSEFVSGLPLLLAYSFLVEGAM